MQAKPGNLPSFLRPNLITTTRIFASVFVFVAIQFGYYLTALVLFLFAAGTDWVDGYLARKYGLVTQLGRVLDPLADKLVVCGAFIYLSSIPGSKILAWMTVVVVVRELAVTVVRSFLEQHGKDFSAAMPGKIKMVLQCAAVATSLWLLRSQSDGIVPHWLPTLVNVLAWTAVVSTVYSGIVYIPAATRLLSQVTSNGQA